MRAGGINMIMLVCEDLKVGKQTIFNFFPDTSPFVLSPAPLQSYKCNIWAFVPGGPPPGRGGAGGVFGAQSGVFWV